MKRFSGGMVVAMALVIAASIAAAPVQQSKDSTVLTRAEHMKLWDRNMDFLERTRTAPIPEALPVPKATDTQDEKLTRWVATYRAQLAENTEAKRKDYERYIENAKGHLEKEQIREALIEAHRALINATDPDALLSTEWVRDLEGRGFAKAEQFRQDSKWTKAYSYYHDLTLLFEENKEYEEGRRRCLGIARLDVMYKKSEEDDAPEPRWVEMFDGIVPQNASEALDRVEKFYVAKADFKAVTRAGLEQLLLFEGSEEMRKTFPGLADEDLREEFVARVGRRLEQVNKSKSDRFRSKNAQSYFRRVIRINEQTIQLPEELVVYEFITAGLDELDAFTSIIWPVEFREFDKHTRGDFVGVGISISGGGNRPISVVSPLEDTPAYRAGIIPNDQITHVNGDSLEGVTLSKAVQIITGPMGTEVTLRIYRESEKRSIDFVLSRALVKIQSVKGFQRDPDVPDKWDFNLDPEMGIGYVRVNSFQENSVDDLSVTLEELDGQGMRGLLLDLRFNPGGLMKSAVEMAQLFLEREDTIVSTRGLRDPAWQNAAPPHDGPYTKLPLIVLVNESSASASEIVSGALQDHRRAIILGERTFGKFSVQKLMQLNGSTAHLKLTTARYYLPSGKEFHHDEDDEEWGVMPNLVHSSVLKERYKIQSMWRKRDILGAVESETDSDDESDKEPDSADGDGKDQDAKEGAKKADDIDGDEELTESQKTVDGAKDKDADDSDDEEEELQLADDPNNLPEIDMQLETALLMMRLHLLSERELLVAAASRVDSGETPVQRP